MAQQIAHEWNTKLYTQKHAFVHHYGEDLLDILKPKAGEQILDLGCGSGELADKIRERGANVLGIDKSPDMITKAKSQFKAVHFRVADASDFELETPVDAIFSNAALHWVTAYKSAITCMYKALKNRGRLVVEFGGKGNVLDITSALRQALLTRGYQTQSALQLWHFPSIGTYTTELEKAGFLVSSAQLIDRPTPLADTENGIIDWLTMFCSPFFKQVNQTDKNEILNEVQQTVQPLLFKSGVWHADYKRLRIVAHKENLT